MDEDNIMDIDIDDIDTGDDETMHDKLEIWAIEYMQSNGINYSVPVMMEPVIKLYGARDCVAFNVSIRIVDRDTQYAYKPYVNINVNLASISVVTSNIRYFTCPFIIISNMHNQYIHKKVMNIDDDRRLRKIAYYLYDSSPLV